MAAAAMTGMNEHKELGKITAARVGLGGYKDVQMGFWVALGGKGWSVCDGRGEWSMERDEFCKWTEADRERGYAKCMTWLLGLLNDAGVSSADKLVGVPIEATFDSPYGKLLSWRILKEVL